MQDAGNDQCPLQVDEVHISFLHAQPFPPRAVKNGKTTFVRNASGNKRGKGNSSASIVTHHPRMGRPRKSRRHAGRFSRTTSSPCMAKYSIGPPYPAPAGT